MIESNHNIIARFLFNAYEYKILKKSFNRFILLNEEIQVDDNKSVIFLPNHFSWWDGFFVDFLVRITDINKKFHIIMLEEQLKNYWFFKFLGAAGFNPSNPKSVLKLSNYINNLLKSPNNLVVFYPQGEIQIYDFDLHLKEGLSYLLKKINSDVDIYYPFFKIQYFDKKFPDLICKVYPGVTADTIVSNYPLFVEDYKNKFYDFKNNNVNINNKRNLFYREQ